MSIRLLIKNAYEHKIVDKINFKGYLNYIMLRYT